ncbi:hypothetical protein BDB00DRAFT_845517 [Zychaea mexicana]|uniref:uncharacterized protein n=1 Tax=Zychaea mexicana TaxID=64656 RepID=UPI0022FEC2E2|nr:uncharacterized protein BDB00DRAFT_845517 [Zychaea mexicana]KAI9489068.1 hypothetical protein BDB00DRAFT_845517 [Zychaea mexicana]
MFDQCTGWLLLFVLSPNDALQPRKFVFMVPVTREFLNVRNVENVLNTRLSLFLESLSQQIFVCLPPLHIA